MANCFSEKIFPRKGVDIKNKAEEQEMKRVYRLEDLDCANCAAKMERAIGKIDGVSAVSVSFLTQKLTLEADEAHFEEIVDQVVKVCRKVEPDCRIIR